jgi:hypothetical protein
MKINKTYLIAFSTLSASFFAVSCGNKSKNDALPNNTQTSNERAGTSPILAYKTELVLSDIYEMSNKTSSSRFHKVEAVIGNTGQDNSNFSIETSVICDGSTESSHQVLSNATTKTLKLTEGKQCKVTIDKFMLDGNDYTPTKGNNPQKLIFIVTKEGNIHASEKAVSYNYLNGSKILFINATTTAAGLFVLGMTDRENRFNASNFNFDKFTLTYNGETTSVFLNETDKYKEKNLDTSKTSFGFVIPDSKIGSLRTISWGGSTEATTFAANVYGEDGKLNQVFLKGYSMTEKCPTYTWVLNAAISHQGCGQSQGFKIEFNPTDNSNLKPGKYSGDIVLQAINWHQIDIFQNILVHLDIKKPEAEKKESIKETSSK